MYNIAACTTLLLLSSTQIFATNQEESKNQVENQAETGRSISRISHDYYDDHYETDEHSRIGRVKKYVEETYVPHGYVEEGYGKDGYGHEVYTPTTYHTSAYHGSVSYGHIDPYLLLAGLGAATLLAYVAYRIIQENNDNDRKKRDLPSDFTDSPDFVSAIYDMIATAGGKFNNDADIEGNVMSDKN